MTRPSRLLARLALETPAARAWALYDWANSGFYTTVVAVVFPVYFVKVAGAGLPEGEATRRLSLASAAAMVVVALLSPALGAIADFRGARKRMLGLFAAVGVVATACLFLVGHGEWPLASVLFVVASVGIGVSLVFYDGLLAHVAPPGRMDQLSATGYALGYLGGGLLLATNLAWILAPERFGLPAGDGETLPVRLAFLSVALWWALFTLPLLRRVPEPARRLESDESAGAGAVRTAFRRLRETLAELRGFRQAFLLLLAALLFGEGIGTIIKLAAAYAGELGIGESTLFQALLVTQFVGIPCAILFGRLAGAIGPRRAIYVGLAVYVGVCVYGAFLRDELDFWVLAIAVGTVQGGVQALARSLFASMIPAHKSAEFFGFFSFASKLAGTAGPLVFFAVGEATSNRWAIVALTSFFLLGWLLLARVDVEAGREAARRAEEGVRPANARTEPGSRP